MNPETVRKQTVSKVKRVVLKLGSSVVTSESGLDETAIEGIVDDVCRYKRLGKEFIIVSSGAIAAGVRRLDLKEGARTIPQKQAAASVGQTRLMAAYEEAFGKHGYRVGQMLLTRDDLIHRNRYLNARNTLMTLLGWNVTPIINENDTVMVEEIKLGDNDNLSALVATLAEVDLLLTLTDQEGFMDCDPQTNPDACLIPLVEELTPDIMKLAEGSTSRVGRGGMASKLEAATKAGRFGIPMIIARGKIPHIIPRVMEGELCGTLILPAKERISARKHWMRYNLVPEGAVRVDEGAARALARGGVSLLPVGVIEVEGHFEHGAAVRVKDPSGKDVALGLVNYSSEELGKIKGRQAFEIDWILGYRTSDEAIHADNLVLMET
ncbi:MAG: glutamate 5-kinase [Deltaproteobacteria bacterium]|nr:glutamate 5-kinase [Deltaproteobacteria bacterium]